MTPSFIVSNRDCGVYFADLLSMQTFSDLLRSMLCDEAAEEWRCVYRIARRSGEHLLAPHLVHVFAGHVGAAFYSEEDDCLSSNRRCMS
jgi:hypothetical protein